MHILVAAKQVLDPDGINSYALWGRLEVSEDGRGFNTGETVPRIINAYDEQAMEAALQIAETREDVRITAVTVGSDTAPDIPKNPILGHSWTCRGPIFGTTTSLYRVF